MNGIYGPLWEAQQELPAIAKSAINPHFGSKYIPLEAIVDAVAPVLKKFGLVWTTLPIVHNGEPALEYRLIHVESDGELVGVMPLLLDKQNSQGLGSAITYARRYALTSVLNIVADVDDDGNKASTPAPKKKVEEKHASFTDQVRATGKKAIEIRQWAGSQGYTLDDVGTDAKGLAKFLNELQPARQKQLLEWAS